MSRCTSCDEILQDHELTRTTTVQLEDGTTKEIYEEFCHRCLSLYVYGYDELNVREYQQEHLTEDLRILLGLNSSTFCQSEE